jgi:glycosyltransferase involved in cell wall biosynthesis
MKVVMDAVFCQRLPNSGIARVYREILPRMCAADPTLEITLLVAGRDRSPLPVHHSIHRRSILAVDRVLRPSRLWWPKMPQAWEFAQRLSVGDGGGRIWHSSYYSMLKRWKGPRVVTVYDMLYERFPNLFSSQRDDAFRKQKQQCVLTSDAIICISRTTAKDLIDLYPVDPARVSVVPLACSDAFSVGEDNGPPRTLTDKRPFLLYVGDRAHYKNTGTLFRAYSNWRGNKEVDLVLVGPDWSEAEKRQLSDLPGADRIRRLNRVDDEELRRLYQGARAFVHPSLYEGFGIPILEAMTCGCPVVASRIPSTEEVAGECPAYFEPTSDDSLCAALDLVMNEGRPSERTRQGIEVARRFSWDKTARRTLDVYHGLGGA